MKIRILEFLLVSVFLIIFNLVFFSAIENFTATRWISYAGITMAYLLMVGSCYFIPKVKRRAVYAYPKTGFAWSYFVIESIVGWIFIITNNDDSTFPMVTQAVILGLYMILYIIIMIADEHSMNTDAREAKDIFFIKNASYELQAILSSASDVEQRKKIDKLFYAIKSSPADSCPQAKGIEDEIMGGIFKIKSAVKAGNFCDKEIDEVMESIGARDRIIRLSRQG